MKKISSILGIYFGLLIIMVIVMSWITMRTLRMEREERLTAITAENERLALWRMESMMLPLILSESARDYTVFMPQLEWHQHSALVAPTSAYVTCFFQSDNTGNIDFIHPIDPPKTNLSNDAKQGDTLFSMNDLLQTDDNKTNMFSTLHALPVKSQPLHSLNTNSYIIAFNQNVGSNPFSNPNAEAQLEQNPFGNDPFENNSPRGNNQTEGINRPLQQTSKPQPIIRFNQTVTNNDFKNREKANQLANSTSLQQNSVQPQMKQFDSQTDVLVTPMTIFWHNDQLLLARLIQNVERDVEDKNSKPTKGKMSQTKQIKMDIAQGCLLDWKQLKAGLVNQIKDLLPNANLVPVALGEKDTPRSLATIPVMLVPGTITLPAQTSWTPMQISLLVAWGWLLLSAVAIGALLFGVVRLSERRATFVSAVTHELRTPLTTFQIYSDLLANRDALTDEKQADYVKTLQSESERLGHLIENVLSWSHLERSADAELIEAINWTEFITRIEPSLTDRATLAGMTLLVKPSDLSLMGNRTAVERILFNLVDNSCKYAKHANNKQIQIELQSDDQQVLISVRDHGPGISPELRSSLFKPFTKSATDAARSAAGVGLGLSLCKRLARQMQGDLVLQDTTPAGVVFQLRLPIAS